MPDFESLEGRVYAVTGASKGMGLRFARALAREGAKVVLLARDSPELETAGKEIHASLALTCDVSDPEDVRQAFRTIQVHHGQLHGLINSAGVCLLHKIEQTTDEEIHQEIYTNLAGPIHCIREAIPLLKAAGGGDIVNISSESVKTPFAYLTLYAATKAGLETLSAGLRDELRPEGIRVTVLRSGRVAESSISRQWSPERSAGFFAAFQAGGHTVSTGKPVAPETMAAMLVQMLRLPREANIDLIDLRSFA